MSTPEDLVQIVAEMPIAQIMKAVKLMEEKFGVSAAAPVAAAVAAAPASAEASSEEAQTEFTVLLTKFGDNVGDKVKVIKALRGLPGVDLSLGDAKAAVESTANGPYEVRAGISKEEAEKFKKELEAASASVEIK